MHNPPLPKEPNIISLRETLIIMLQEKKYQPYYENKSDMRRAIADLYPHDKYQSWLYGYLTKFAVKDPDGLIDTEASLINILKNVFPGTYKSYFGDLINASTSDSPEESVICKSPQEPTLNRIATALERIVDFLERRTGTTINEKLFGDLI